MTNVTGELDDFTVQQIVRPRCGVAYIVNGTSTMNSGKSNTSTRFHTVAHYTLFPGEPRWPQSKHDLTYAFNPDNNLSDEVKSVFASAFDRWSTVTPLTFTMTTSAYTADIKIGFYNGDHGDHEGHVEHGDRFGVGDCARDWAFAWARTFVCGGIDYVPFDLVED